MDIKYGKGLVFELDDGREVDVSSSLTEEREEALQQIIRQGFRAPVGLSQQMTLTIAGNTYAVFNLSGSGVGFYLNGPGQFEIKASLRGITFSIGSQSFTVDGTVVHLASDGAHDLCGIELTTMPPECREAIVDYLRKSRNSLFAP